jgi:ELWxxDGT repeat protein
LPTVYPPSIHELTPVGDSLYFATNGNRVWRSDGTAAGTQEVAKFGRRRGRNSSTSPENCFSRRARKRWGWSCGEPTAPPLARAWSRTWPAPAISLPSSSPLSAVDVFHFGRHALQDRRHDEWHDVARHQRGRDQGRGRHALFHYGHGTVGKRTARRLAPSD